MKIKRRANALNRPLAIKASQNEKGIFKAMEMHHELRKDRNWLADEVRRLRGILDDAGVEYEKRVMRTPEEIKERSEHFND